MYELKKLKSFKGRSGPVLVIVMDGVGIGKQDHTDAVFLAKPQNLIKYKEECSKKNLYTQLKAHGPAVGLPSEKDMGNSEVGHNAMGAGKIYDQGAKLVNGSIESGRMFETELWKKHMARVVKENKTVHFIGLLSDGNVHSHITQLFGIMNGVVEAGVKNVRIHPLLDGRDVPARSALEFIKPLEDQMKEIMKTHDHGSYDYRIASGGGRMYVTMDRYESDWNVVKRGWNAHVRGIVDDKDILDGYSGYFHSAEEAILKAREVYPDKNDQTAPPFVIVDDKNEPIGKMVDGDLVINFNFRGDRAIQITKAFESEKFDAFDRVYYPTLQYLGLLEYDDEAHLPKEYLVPPPDIQNTLGDYCCANDIKQFAIAETHKYGHVTYFWNGNRSGYVCPDKEKYVEIKSEPTEMIPNNPKMKAYEVTEETIKALKSGDYDFVRVNLANGDMVGHTGIMDATITAVKTVDECVAKMVDVINELGGIALITADHGNADEMLMKDGSPKTSHTLNPVPCFIIDKNWDGEYEMNSDVSEPGISNLASTVLNLLGYEAPEEYRESLIKIN